MRLVMIGLALVLASSPAFAQQGAAAPKGFASAADVAALVAKAKSERKDQALIGQSLLQLAPYNVNIGYRASVGTASVHEQEAELFYVVDGSATIVTGGTLVKANRTNPTNLTGDGVQGGKSQKIGKGDVILVPEGTPHWISQIDGTVVLMSIHLPRPARTTP